MKMSLHIEAKTRDATYDITQGFHPQSGHSCLYATEVKHIDETQIVPKYLLDNTSINVGDVLTGTSRPPIQIGMRLQSAPIEQLRGYLGYS